MENATAIMPLVWLNLICFLTEPSIPDRPEYKKYTQNRCARDVENELLIVQYLNIHVRHDKKQCIPIYGFLRFTQWCINVTRDVFYVCRLVDLNENSKSKCIHHVYIWKD